MKRHSACSPIVPMPRVTPAKRPTLVEKRARALCVKLARVTDDTPMEYRMVRLMARVLALNHETADAAIGNAIQKGWLIGKGEPPHSICLTDEGRLPPVQQQAVERDEARLLISGQTDRTQCRCRGCSRRRKEARSRSGSQPSDTERAWLERAGAISSRVTERLRRDLVSRKFATVRHRTRASSAEHASSLIVSTCEGGLPCRSAGSEWL